MTLEKLAQMVERGFAETALRGDIHKLEERIGALEKSVEYGFDRVDEAIKSIREELKRIDQTVEVYDLEVRVGRLERKANLRK